MFDNPVFFAALFGQTTAFSPLSLFAAGDQGFWYDPSDFSTMFQDNLGATPVTATGQVVGLIRDKSGKGNDATQSNASFKPTLQQDASGFYYLSFDGTDDGMATASIDFSASDKMSLFAGMRKLSDTAYQMMAEFSVNSSSNNGAFGVVATSGAGVAATNALAFGLRGNVAAGYDATTVATPSTNVLSVVYDIGAAAISGEIAPRVNTATPTLTSTSGANAGTGNFGNYPLYIGRRGGSSLPANIRLYSLIGLGAAASAAQITSTETWINARTGAY